MTARCFLVELPAGGLRAATVEDTRDALARITGQVSAATGRQCILRSLLATPISSAMRPSSAFPRLPHTLAYADLSIWTTRVDILWMSRTSVGSAVELVQRMQ